MEDYYRLQTLSQHPKLGALHPLTELCLTTTQLVDLGPRVDIRRL